MEFTLLTPEQKKSFEKDGYLVVRNALDAKTNQEVIDACDKFAHTFLHKDEVLHRPWYNDLDFRPGLLQNEALFNLVTQSSVVPLIIQLLSPNIHLHSTALTYKRPEAPDLPPFRRGWHRDIRIPRDLGHVNLPMVGIKVCYCLTDFVEKDAGITLMARKTHLRNEPLKIPKGQIDPPDVEVAELSLKAGDAVLFENRIFHTATPNRTKQVAKRLIYGYAYRWMKQEIYLDTPDKELLKKSTPIMHQLLGGSRDIDTPAWALQDWVKKHGVAKDRVPWILWEEPKS